VSTITPVADYSGDGWSPHDWAARFGEEHDTWHRPDEPGEGGLTVTSMVPNPVPQNTSLPDARIHGTGFVDGALVFWGLTTPAEKTTAFISETELSLSLGAQAVAGNYKMYVRNPDGQQSNQILVPVAAPPPVLTSITPNTGSVTVPSIYDIVAIGTGFTLASKVWLGDQALNSTLYQGSTELRFDIATSLEPVGEQMVTVRNGPTAISNGLPFTVTA
jgi:hypothetical protein